LASIPSAVGWFTDCIGRLKSLFMDPVGIDWSTATVAHHEDSYALEVRFHQPSEPFWWEAFTAALEILSKETTGARWETIRGVGDPPEGLHVSGVDEDSVGPLRRLLDSAVEMANQEAELAEAAREARKRALEERANQSTDTADRLTQAFRTGTA
jgi:hypothetical protein